MIKERNNFEKLKLLEIYSLLTNSLIKDKNYLYIDDDLINFHLNKISMNYNYSYSLSSAGILKEYLKYVRDISNSIYIMSNSKKINITNIICCV